ncbi:MAG: hypothetical protein AAB467_04570 [Patescibacteria group bacterium]
MVRKLAEILFFAAVLACGGVAGYGFFRAILPILVVLGIVTSILFNSRIAERFLHNFRYVGFAMFAALFFLVGLVLGKAANLIMGCLSSL